MKLADLHLHTRYSDGTYTPAELVREAKARNLAAIALTDHDTMAGIGEFQAAAQPVGLTAIAGVEITSQVAQQEIHLLGYFFTDQWRDSTLAAVLTHATQVREERVRQFVVRLNELDVPITMADVAACSEYGTYGRPHIAQALVRRGIVASVDEAFERFLKRGKPAYVERYRLPVAEAIRHVRLAGGVAVLAHPGLYRVEARFREMKDQGLGGLEVWHSQHSPAQAKHFLELATELDLVATGGSDCHGPIRNGPLLGKVTVPWERLEALQQRAN